MPSFDVVSEIDQHELSNALDQTNREVSTRYDFKGSDAKVEESDGSLTMEADNEFQLGQLLDIIYKKMAKRGIDVQHLEPAKIEVSGRRARQRITIHQGIDKELGRKIIKLIKDSKLKVQTAIQGEQLRVSGKKRDDLQEVISVLRETDVGLPLQYVNFRD